MLRVSSGKTYSFSEAIKQALRANGDDYKGRIIEAGLYYEQVNRYLNIFGKDNVKILIFEEFIKNTKATVKEVLDFLGVNSEPPDFAQLPHNLLTKPFGRLSLAILGNKTMRQVGRRLLPQLTDDIIVKKILGKKIEKPDMPKHDRDFLEKFYKDDVKNLQKIIGRKVLWSLVKN